MPYVMPQQKKEKAGDGGTPSPAIFPACESTFVGRITGLLYPVPLTNLWLSSAPGFASSIASLMAHFAGTSLRFDSSNNTVRSTAFQPVPALQQAGRIRFR